jgi:hypothetical protein
MAHPEMVGLVHIGKTWHALVDPDCSHQILALDIPGAGGTRVEIWASRHPLTQDELRGYETMALTLLEAERDRVLRKIDEIKLTPDAIAQLHPVVGKARQRKH